MHSFRNRMTDEGGRIANHQFTTSDGQFSIAVAACQHPSKRIGLTKAALSLGEVYRAELCAGLRALLLEGLCKTRHSC